MSMLKLKAACKDYIWGGERIKREYGIEYEKDPLAEAWVLSSHPDGPSVIEGGEYAGETFREYIKKQGAKAVGNRWKTNSEFPVLIKLIDAEKSLSIQVHPDDEYAGVHEGQKGKTEMWYIVDAAPGAFIYYGFKEEISKEEFENRIGENTLTEVLNKVTVHKGDSFFIKAGTLHAIGAGCLIAEVQQNSNVTYRVYDYDRVGADGKKRELHIAKALDVTDRNPPEPYKAEDGTLASCEYFTTGLLKVNESDSVKISVTDESFKHLLVLSGSLKVSSGNEELFLKKGDSLFLPVGTGEAELYGSAEILETSLPE